MIYNLSKKNIIAVKPVYARSFLARGRGMIGRNFSNFDGMIFEHCNSIHTLFMSMNIDVLFIDGKFKVCSSKKSLKPWFPLIRNAEACTVIELPEGTIEKTKTEPGDYLNMSAELTEKELKSLGVDIITSSETVISSFSENEQ